MKLGTQLTIGLTVVALGVGVLALGFVDQEAAVRQVADVTGNPAAHLAGTYTLVGIPQPEVLTTFANGGGEPLSQPNPQFRNETRHHAAWEADDGSPRVSTLVLSVDGPRDGVSHWSLRNETRIPGQGLAGTPTYTNWTVQGPHTVMLIQGFPDADGETPWLFGVYEGVLREPLQPKPSQFEGRVAKTLPGGVPVPPGALVFQVEEYTAGCSSKFIPEEHRDEYADAEA